MSRRYPVAELYEERERDVYRNGRRSTREFEEIDIARGQPDFLREDYGRSSHAGPLVVRGGRDTVDVDVRTRRSSPPPASQRASPPRSVRGGRREIEKEEIIIRDEHTERPRRRTQSMSRDEFTIRRSQPELRPRPREIEREDIDINIRRDEDTRSVRSSRPREVERDDIDINIRRSETDRPPPSRPREFERDEFVIRRGEGSRRGPPRSREVETEELIIRREQSESRAPPPPASTRRGGDDIDIDIRRTERRPPPPASTRGGDELDIDIRRTERRPPPPASTRREEEIDIDIRRNERPPPPPSTRRGEEIDINIRRDERAPPPSSRRGTVDEDIDIDVRNRGRHYSPSRERITIREKSRGPRERSLPPQLVARETEEFVIRRRKPPSPSPSPPPPRMERDTITIRQRVERSPSPPPPPPPEPELPPPPVLAPIIRPPIHQEIHQEIITHHRHIDHGVERARSPTPPPPPPAREPTPPPVKEKVDSLEIDIRRRGGDKYSKEDIDINIDRRSRSRGPPVEERSLEVSRPRSLDAPRRYYDDDVEAEADYYNRKALERAYPGEAYNGATKDWAIVDVPPGTERVEMRGAGGGSQEISWQRYNGVRRSKFKTGDREFDTEFGAPAPVEEKQIALPPPSRRPADMWTEITKDLVIKEAIEHMGYDYEETEFFFYVMEYLKYEDVLQLVEVSDEIRHARRRRIREIEWEREDLRANDRDYYEREVIIDRRERRY